MLIDGHPVTASDYSGTDEEVAAEMNVANIDRDAGDITSQELWETVDGSEFGGLKKCTSAWSGLILMSRKPPNLNT